MYSPAFRLRSSKNFRFDWDNTCGYGGSSIICADNLAHLSCFCFGQTALVDVVGFSPHFGFLIIVADFKIDVRVKQAPQISNKMVKELITLEREYVQNCKNIFTEGDRKEKQLANFP